MLANNTSLKNIISEVSPEILQIFPWYDIWDRRLENGTGYEWTVFASVIKAAKDKGWDVKYPLVDYPEIKDLFVYRNELPYQHGAQAGHSFNANANFSLAERFIASLIPKAIITKGTTRISIFREGLPYHKIMSANDYLDRPDIIFVPGALTPGYPNLENDNILNFSFSFNNNKKITGQLRVVDSNIRPIKSRNPIEGMLVPTIGIIECSVNKKIEVVKEQVNRYRSLFNDNSQEPNVIVVTGNKLKDSSLKTYETKLDLPEADLLARFLQVGQSVVDFLLP
jgi:hypothetical protein